MKKLLFFALLASATLFTACKNIDQTLLGDMQNKLTELDALKTTLTNNATGISDLATMVGAAPEAVKANPEFAALSEMANGMVTKNSSLLQELGSMQTNLSGMVADYTAGKIKTDDVKTKFAEVPAFLSGATESSSKMTTVLATLKAQYDAMATAPAAAPAKK